MAQPLVIKICVNEKRLFDEILNYKDMENYSSKTEAIIGLQNKGYYLDFILSNECLLCVQDSALISPDDFEIEETYMFDSKVKSDDKNLIYAINSVHNGLKGILMTSYSAFTRGLSIHLWSKLAANLEFVA